MPYDDMSNKYRGIRKHFESLGLRNSLDVDPFESSQDKYGLCDPTTPLRDEVVSLKNVRRRR